MEAVYSSEEAFEWASKLDWDLVVLDDQLPYHGDGELIQGMRNGADYYVFGHSLGGLVDLPVVVKEVLDKRDLRRRWDSSQNRYRSLIEIAPGTVYELDAEGRLCTSVRK